MAIDTEKITGFFAAGIANTQLGSLIAARRSLTKEQYIDAVLRDPIEGLVDLEPVRTRCSRIKPHPGLIWDCEIVKGGLGNVGNLVADCVLFGLEAGATTIIMPRIGIRDESNLSDLGDQSHSTDLSFLFDVDAFMSSWTAACPNVRVVLSADELPEGLPDAQNTARLEPWKLPGLDKFRKLVVDPINYRVCLDRWLVKSVPQAANMSTDRPFLVSAAEKPFNWHRTYLDSDFARAYARFFVFNRELRRLGAAALWSLEQRLGSSVVADALLFPSLFDSSPSSSSSEPVRNTSLVNTLGHNRLVSDGFMGVHLRTASDAANARWPGYESQAPQYIDMARTKNFSHIYIATGSPEHRMRFINDSAVHNLTVYWKEELLADTGDLETLKSLAWDQQAVVDMQVLLYSGFFMGMGRSSFSWAVAVRRSVIPEAGPLLVDYSCYPRAIEGVTLEPGYVPDATSEIGLTDDINVVLCDYLMHLADSTWQ
ncbi:inducible alternative oxidase 2 [Sporothrix bragantina]|uniref:Inducible alternative oxidase 2 n=1 Tax=Sporothrix bragantina TaxID=671064 RepID=A0ABP0CDW1_9PEZI